MHMHLVQGISKMFDINNIWNMSHLVAAWECENFTCLQTWGDLRSPEAFISSISDNSIARQNHHLEAHCRLWLPHSPPTVFFLVLLHFYCYNNKCWTCLPYLVFPRLALDLILLLNKDATQRVHCRVQLSQQIIKEDILKTKPAIVSSKVWRFTSAAPENGSNSNFEDMCSLYYR
jgi:hypothetical protein